MDEEQTLASIKAYLNQNDRFCKCNGMAITVLKPGYAEAEMSVVENMLNGVNIVQGGALYTLADLAFAGAVNSHGMQAVGMSSHISYVRPGSGSRIRAVATEVNRGKRTGLYNVDLFDDQDRLLARASMTAFISDKPFNTGK